MSTLLPPAWSDPADSDSPLELLDFPTLMLQQVAQHLRQNHIRPLLDRHELSVPEYRTLAILAVQGRVSSARIREFSSMDKAQLSRTLRQLEERGLVERKILPDHERRQWLSLTDEGQQLFSIATAQVRALQLELLRNLTATERRGLYSALRKLVGLSVAQVSREV